MKKIVNRGGRLVPLYEGKVDVFLVRLIQRITSEGGEEGFRWVPVRVLKVWKKKLIGTIAGISWFSRDTLVEVELSERKLFRKVDSVVVLPDESEGVKVLFFEFKPSDVGFFKDVVDFYFSFVEGKVEKERKEERKKEIEEFQKEFQEEFERQLVQRQVQQQVQHQVQQQEQVQQQDEIFWEEEGDKAGRVGVRRVDLVERPTEKQINYVRDLMARAGFSQALVERFISLMSREEASNMIELLKERKKSSAIELVNVVIGKRGDQGEDQGSVVDSDVAFEESEAEFDEEEIPW